MVASHAPLRGNPMAPPQLARDTPVVDIFEPVEKYVLPSLGMEGRVAFAHRLDRAIGHRAHAQEPLLGEHRLDDGVASRTYADRMFVRLDLFEESRRFQVPDDLLARVLARHPAIGAAVVVDVPSTVQNRNLLEAVALAELEVDRIVRGRDLQRAGAEFTIDRGVGDDFYLALDQRQSKRLA